MLKIYKRFLAKRAIKEAGKRLGISYTISKPFPDDDCDIFVLLYKEEDYERLINDKVFIAKKCKFEDETNKYDEFEIVVYPPSDWQEKDRSVRTVYNYEDKILTKPTPMRFLMIIFHYLAVKINDIFEITTLHYVRSELKKLSKRYGNFPIIFNRPPKYDRTFVRMFISDESIYNSIRNDDLIKHCIKVFEKTYGFDISFYSEKDYKEYRELQNIVWEKAI